MPRNYKVSKEVKIKACEDYRVGKGSYDAIAKAIGVNSTTLREWYSAFIYHGSSVSVNLNLVLPQNRLLIKPKNNFIIK
ncbi:transposase [bacterium]|nr:transposase [bacterium]